MDDKKYQFYVLFSEEDPENIRYVGVTTKQINERFSQHKYCATHSDKRGLPVHKWMYSKYKNGGNILYKKIDECEDYCWEEREQYWIDYYKKLGFKLLNISKGGKGIITLDMRSKSSIQRSIEGHEIPVLALNKDGSIFMSFDSAVKAARYFNVARNSITNVLNGWSKSSCGYLWVRKDEYDPNIKYSYTPDTDKKKIKVYEFSMCGELIKIWDKITDFDNIEGYSQNGVRSAIKNRKEYHGSYFSLEESINISEFKSPYKFYINVNNSIQYFKSQRELAKFLNISESRLSITLKNNIFNINGFEIIKI